MPDTLFGTFKNWMLIGAPLIAMLLAFLQIYPELRRDQWEFLFHRPLTPNQIWGAKVITGLAVYFASTLIPLFAFVAWYCIPNHFPGPFNAHLALPGVLSILTGLPFYFAGLLVTQRSFRGVWSKLLAFCGAGSCLACSVTDSVAGNPWLIALIAAIFTLPLAIASQGSFKNRGEIAGQTISQTVMLGAVFATGWLIVIGIAFGFITSIINVMHPQKTGWKSPAYESFGLTAQGRLVILDSTTPENAGGHLTAVYDLAGDAIPGASLDNNDYVMGTELWARQDGSFTGSGILGYLGYQSWFQSIDMGGCQLYYDEASRVIDIYSQIPNTKLIGYIGADNIIKDSPNLVTQFPSGIPSINGGVVSFENAVYHVQPVDSAESLPMISKVIQTAEDDPIIAASGTNLPGIDSAVCVVSKHHLSVYTKHNVLVKHTPLDLTPGQFYTFALLQATDNTPVYLVNQVGIGYDSSNNKVPFSVAHLKSCDGIVVATVPGTTRFWAAPRPIIQEWQSIFLPLASATIARVLIFCIERLDTTVLWNPDQYKALFGPLVWSLIGGLIAMAAFVPFARRYGALGLKLIPWMVCGFFMSWLGVLVILSMRPFPVLINCWNCGRKRSVDSETCQHCGKPQSNPADRVSFIFEESEPAGCDLYKI